MFSPDYSCTNPNPCSLSPISSPALVYPATSFEKFFHRLHNNALQSGVSRVKQINAPNKTDGLLLFDESKNSNISASHRRSARQNCLQSIKNNQVSKNAAAVVNNSSTPPTTLSPNIFSKTLQLRSNKKNLKFEKFKRQMQLEGMSFPEICHLERFNNLNDFLDSTEDSIDSAPEELIKQVFQGTELDQEQMRLISQKLVISDSSSGDDDSRQSLQYHQEPHKASSRMTEFPSKNAHPKFDKALSPSQAIKCHRLASILCSGAPSLNRNGQYYFEPGS